MVRRWIFLLLSEFEGIMRFLPHHDVVRQTYGSSRRNISMAESCAFGTTKRPCIADVSGYGFQDGGDSKSISYGSVDRVTWYLPA
jgi:hypothetical protein